MLPAKKGKHSDDEEMDEEDEMKDKEDYSKKKKLPSITSTPNVMYMTG